MTRLSAQYVQRRAQAKRRDQERANARAAKLVGWRRSR